MIFRYFGNIILETLGKIANDHASDRSIAKRERQYPVNKVLIQTNQLRSVFNGTKHCNIILKISSEEQS